ncbi:MAG: flagellar M-ring protein FliF [Balneolaceae bacterium]|nr:flagellar M-ring protein FliF [Balneolaceae bacterium]MCH8547899.1 flagellar M-ring protein FliF [Balneolaceae bacterium]
MKQLADNFQEFYGPLSPAQRTMFVGMIAAIVLFVGLLFYWALKPDYSLLFGSLPADSANEIVMELEEKGVPYRLEDGGRSIYVPSGDVHSLRINLAAEGFTSSDVQGYELFDANSLGMTDFMQQVNKKRALEGELTRSINSLDQVEFSRIHLVLPERTPFQQTSVQASASVILTLNRGKRLSTEQVEGITALVAGSVQGLNMEDVTILDHNGNRLTDGLESRADSGSGSLQMQLRKKTEDYLTERGQTMLDRVLGPGNSILRVAAEHDFDRLVRESDIIDPDSRTIISEERRTDINNDESSQMVPIDEFTPIDRRGETVITSNRNQESTTQTRNYEVNTTREIYEKTQGEIRRIAGSVLINYKQQYITNDEGERELVSEPYTEEEIAEFREVIRNALGIQPNRGDEITITQMQFHDPMADDPSGWFVDQPTPWGDIFRWGVILVTFGLIVFLIYSIRNRMGAESTSVMFKEEFARDFQDGSGSPEIPEGEEMQNLEDMTEEEQADFINNKLSGSARKQLKQKEYVLEEIRDFVELKPQEAAQVMKAMMSEDED